MHGYARPVERKIRLWIAQQESNRRKDGQMVRVSTRGEAHSGDAQRPAALRPHEQWL